mmetsp:Transcript_55142/g.107855  ORF Transcript_55142/g.107855 Transcript_55142/m.107855 type:complete len:82 (-) Transcript_55142:977-1222(-)
MIMAGGPANRRTGRRPTRRIAKEAGQETGGNSQTTKEKESESNSEKVSSGTVHVLTTCLPSLSCVNCKLFACRLLHCPDKP